MDCWIGHLDIRGFNSGSRMGKISQEISMKPQIRKRHEYWVIIWKNRIYPFTTWKLCITALPNVMKYPKSFNFYQI